MDLNPVPKGSKKLLGVLPEPHKHSTTAENKKQYR
jgi:hypothetical protein